MSQNLERHIILLWWNFSIRLLTGVPIGGNKSLARNHNMAEIKEVNSKPEKQRDIQNASANSMVSYGKGITPSEVPFMKSVLPVTSLFSTIKSGVQTSVTAAVKAGKILPDYVLESWMFACFVEVIIVSKILVI